jgi:acetolactate decarboxylase
MTTVYTANTRQIYRAGTYDGTHAIGELRRHGTFGLGALDRNDGELIILEGRAFRTGQDGTTTELGDSATTPYAAVLSFAPGQSHSLPTSGTKADLEDQLLQRLPTNGRGWAVRIHGHFVYVEAGAGPAQTPPYRPLQDVFAEYRWLRHERTVGTLVGMTMPTDLSSIDVPGFHFHWLSDDHSQGGHVIDYVAEDVAVEVCEATTFIFGLTPTDSAV